MRRLSARMARISVLSGAIRGQYLRTSKPHGLMALRAANLPAPTTPVCHSLKEF
jgi:hypothetical protein